LRLHSHASYYSWLLFFSFFLTGTKLVMEGLRLAIGSLVAILATDVQILIYALLQYLNQPIIPQLMSVQYQEMLTLFAGPLKVSVACA
jgi:hypothetical protein